MVTDKQSLRTMLRTARRAHVAAQPDSIRALLFHHPPRPVLEQIADEAVIGLYRAGGAEAPATGYARHFRERGHTIALPRFASETTPMKFCEHTDPFGETDLEPGPFGLRQPGPAARPVTPDVLFVPVVGFTVSGKRLGQGGGHYDRWIAEHRGVRTVGLAWDIQLVEPEDALPTEPHDMTLEAIVTPTRLYGTL
jgi:5-formyltetrahydrofolate cyclo-ligase